MAKHVFAVAYQTEILHQKDGKILHRHHGDSAVHSVIASHPEAAVAYVREKLTTDSVRVIRCGAQLVLANIDLIPDAEPTPATPAASAASAPASAQAS